MLYCAALKKYFPTWDYVAQLVLSFWSLLEGLSWGFVFKSWSQVNWLAIKFFPFQRKENLECKIHSKPLIQIKRVHFWSRCSGCCTFTCRSRCAVLSDHLDIARPDNSK